MTNASLAVSVKATVSVKVVLFKIILESNVSVNSSQGGMKEEA